MSLLETVSPGGLAMARDLQSLVAHKESSHYALAFVGQAEGQKMVTWAKRLAGSARKAVES